MMSHFMMSVSTLGRQRRGWGEESPIEKMHFAHAFFKEWFVSLLEHSKCLGAKTTRNGLKLVLSIGDLCLPR